AVIPDTKRANSQDCFASLAMSVHVGIGSSQTYTIGNRASMLDLRRAEPSDLPALARLWHAAWHETHAPLSPDSLVRLRTLDSFADRLAGLLPETTAAGPVERPLGFCAIKADELYQLFVAPQARGLGVAAALLADGEARLAATGCDRAFLTCAVGNERAARFYEKSGWHNVGTVTETLETVGGPYAMQVWRFEKALT
ncbi:MAG: GNAT family N-acetyltransferase, partial [Minwuiales bacterium]|nr:GNAT family N-acetyltransferase [Minwuiales bacterium]